MSRGTRSGSKDSREMVGFSKEEINTLVQDTVNAAIRNTTTLFNQKLRDLQECHDKEMEELRGQLTEEKEEVIKLRAQIRETTLAANELSNTPDAHTSASIASPSQLKRTVRGQSLPSSTNGRSLKGQRISISEDLTSKNQNLLRSLQNSANFQSAWSWKGHIYAKPVGENAKMYIPPDIV
ncbi:hypothetical protein CAPTEDRAFT_187386 [Capitella teleta]|uniref:Uncharacterized protein n=1 Tax=Capitella teleta TaxID=283909 RepID=R7TZ05_CAPTE|nr:hypothetical protein CAPTEDRAFT_187386 [Capitella teleta]|eukprot:ELT96651.1 hypothetical protein CAPTEDRAFT_187386 [Capitella teleta]